MKDEERKRREKQLEDATRRIQQLVAANEYASSGDRAALDQARAHQLSVRQLVVDRWVEDGCPFVSLSALREVAALLVSVLETGRDLIDIVGTGLDKKDWKRIGALVQEIVLSDVTAQDGRDDLERWFRNYQASVRRKRRSRRKAPKNERSEG